jgi:D-alanyl-D-alanine carboxypeptidase
MGITLLEFTLNRQSLSSSAINSAEESALFGTRVGAMSSRSHTNGTPASPLPQMTNWSAIAHKPYFPPGQGYHYSNTNFILLGMIIEQITGRPVRDVLRTRILQPLGLTHTIFPTTMAMPSPHVHGYSADGGPLTEVNTTANMSWGWTAGAMISTLADLHTWVQALATGRVLSPALQKQRLTLSPPSVAYFRHHGVAGGYGLAIAKVHGFIGHNGGLPGFTTDAWYLPALQATIVVIANSDAVGKTQEQALADPADQLFTRLAKIVPGLQHAA